MKKNHPDYVLLLITITIIVFGLFILAGTASIGTSSKFAKHIFGLLLGIFLAVICFKIPLTKIEKFSPYAFFINIILLLLLFVPSLGVESRGSTRWLDLGFFSFQPSELLKLTIVLYLASWFISKTQNKKCEENQKKIFITFFIICFIVGLLIFLQPNYSMLVIITGISSVVYFCAKTSFRYIILMLIIATTLLGLSIFFNPYQIKRVKSLFNYREGTLEENYQRNQFFIATGSGGFLGVGIGNSRQKFGWVPFPESDSIYAILAEETGFLGSSFLLLLFFLFFLRGLLIAKNNRSNFARLVAMGISTWIFAQVLVHVAVVVGIFPVTGVPLPLVSYGKSHLLTELMALGVLFNASQYKK